MAGKKVFQFISSCRETISMKLVAFNYYTLGNIAKPQKDTWQYCSSQTVRTTLQATNSSETINDSWTILMKRKTFNFVYNFNCD